MLEPVHVGGVTVNSPRSTTRRTSRAACGQATTCRPARGRRDPAGDLARAPRRRAGGSRAGAAPAGALPGCGTATGRRTASSPLPDRDCPGRRWQLCSTSSRAGRWTSTGSARRGLAADGARARAGARGLLSADSRSSSRRSRASRDLRAQGGRLDRGLEGASVRTRAVRGRIEGVGSVTGRNLAQRFRSIDALTGATARQIADTPGIGPIVGTLITSSCGTRSCAPLIEDLRALGSGSRRRGRRRKRAARGPARSC